MQAHLEGGHTRLFTRRGHDWTPRFVALAGALTDLPANNLVLDGEVIVQGETGVADFDALQAELASGRAERMVYFAFDLLHLDGFDLRMRLLFERKRVLAALLEEAKSECFHLAQHLDAPPTPSSSRPAPWASRASCASCATRPTARGTARAGSRSSASSAGVFPIPAPGAIAALHLARREGKALAYAGRAGFSQKSARELRQVLDALATDRPPVQGTPLRPKSTWVRPELSAAVEYTPITHEGLLRHASFKGLKRPAPGDRH